MLVKRLLTLISLACLASMLDRPAQAQQPTPVAILWLADAEQAISAARQSGRPILVFVTSSHCGYCRKMEQQTWADPRVIEQVRQRTVPLRVSAETQPRLVEQFGVRAFPTTLLFAPDGRNIGAEEGFLSPGEVAKLIP
jgi:protein disulfide-isomerase